MNIATQDQIGNIALQERRAFFWASIGAGAAVLSCGGLFATMRWLGWKYQQLGASSDLEEFSRIIGAAVSWQIGCGISLVLSLLLFAIFLMRWLILIRKRRRAEAEQLPARS